MINVCRVKISDFWIYPQPIRPGDWRATIARPYHRAVQRQYIKPNRFAWKLRQALFNYAIDDDPGYIFDDEFFDDEANGGSLEYWAGDVPMLCDYCPDRNICLELGCEHE